MRRGELTRQIAYDLFLEAKVAGLGPAYFTKLIHFFLGEPAYILDQWTAKSVNLLAGESYVALSGNYVAGRNLSDVYERYCRDVESIAKELAADPADIEEKLFSRGHPRPQEWRVYVRMTWRPAGSRRIKRRPDTIPRSDKRGGLQSSKRSS
jgi:hypothetical protein